MTTHKTTVTRRTHNHNDLVNETLRDIKRCRLHQPPVQIGTNELLPVIKHSRGSKQLTAKSLYSLMSVTRHPEDAKQLTAIQKASKRV